MINVRHVSASSTLSNTNAPVPFPLSLTSSRTSTLYLEPGISFLQDQRHQSTPPPLLSPFIP